MSDKELTTEEWRKQKKEQRARFTVLQRLPYEVDNHYMANLKQKERVKRLVITGNNLTRKKTKFIDDGQLEFL